MMVRTMKGTLLVILMLTPIYILATNFKSDPLRQKMDGINITSAEELQTALHRLRDSTTGHLNLTLLEIENLHLSGLPHRLFKGSSIRQLILRDITLQELHVFSPNNDSLFDGLQESLESIAFLGIHITGEVNKSHTNLLSGFKKLNTIIMTRSSENLFTFTDNFSGMKDVPLARIMLTSTKYTDVYPGSLSYFGETLEELVLQGCSIIKGRRSWFGDAIMKVLRRIDLSFNDLISIEPQFFTGMPNLKEVDLQGNILYNFLNETEAVFDPLNLMNLTYFGLYDTGELDCHKNKKRNLYWLIKDNGVKPPFYERPYRELQCTNGTAVKSLRMKQSSTQQHAPSYQMENWSNSNIYKC